MASEVVLDSSALVAMISGEASATDLLIRAESFTTKLVAAPSLVETSMVLISRKGLSADVLTSFLERISATVVPFDEAQSQAAVEAYLRFGRGRHPAVLNYGDCLGYALAKVHNAPLLFVGDDFGQTDIAVA